MHMNVAPHLLTEDRAEFERVVDDALRNARDHPDLAEAGIRLSTSQLRAMALNATALITTAAAAEYDHFVKVREQVRAASRGPSGTSGSATGSATRDGTGTGSTTGTNQSSGTDERSGSGSGSGTGTSTSSGTGERPAGTGGETGSAEGAGVVAVVTVLAPLLAGTAAVVVLLVGAILKMLDPAPAFADTLLTAGLFFGVVAAAGLLWAATGLLVTARRNSATQVAGDIPDDELTRARDTWRRALLERGVLPFLREALAAASADPPPPPPLPRQSPPPAGRIPKIGYSGPDFTSPSKGASDVRPTYSSPDFTSPDRGSPEPRPE
ncbi:hypothetical protein [Streptomyces roseicoloratus]|uniref:hypothetical protein n=1 Tax=Streptomyces roseicoloratus TaxID=2508722 RepID=UPI001009CFA7|nr:hypothetical protein [Streptomyces roseicoloratus]